MGPNIKALAKIIRNAGYEVELTKSSVSTDRKIPGTRLRHIGKRREGYRLIVKKDGKKLLDHNTAETYRTNSEVIEWANRQGIKLNL